jgi:hypothetical protein
MPFRDVPFAKGQLTPLAIVSENSQSLAESGLDIFLRGENSG